MGICGGVYGEGLFRVYSSARAKVGELNGVVDQQNILPKVSFWWKNTALCHGGKCRSCACARSSAEFERGRTSPCSLEGSDVFLSVIKSSNLPFIASYMFMSISSNTSASLPVGSSLASS